MKKHYLFLTLILTLTSISACTKAQENTTAPVEKSMSTEMPIADDTKPLSNVMQDNSGKTVLYWYDPMVADKKFDKPGKSPFMDMQLVPKYKDESSQP